LVVILTALGLIFTIGLGDNRDQGGLSAYSVFNRGFQRLLGEVDADALLQQHVGGGMAMAAAGIGVMPPPLVHDEEGPPPARNHPRARRAAAAAAIQQHNDNDDPNNNNADEENNDDGNNQPGQSRKSGKKARRRNLEERRELQRQRQAAIDMGFEGGDHAEAMAMQRLLEEQFEAVNNQRQAGAGEDANNE
jgi:uncharacterized membrane protein YccC